MSDPKKPSGGPKRPGEPEQDRAAILARRAAFVASALAALTQTDCKGAEPMPCLDIVPDRDGEVAPTTVTVDGPLDAGAPAVDDAAAPMPCLEIVPPHDAGRPRPCLSVRPPLPPQPPATAKPRPCLDFNK